MAFMQSQEMMQAQIDQQLVEIERLKAIINSPLNDDFLKGVSIEAEHQRQRWSTDHDAQKNGWDWFWTIGFLSQKAAAAFEGGDFEKAKHHCISTAALMMTMHRFVSEREAEPASSEMSLVELVGRQSDRAQDLGFMSCSHILDCMELAQPKFLQEVDGSWSMEITVRVENTWPSLEAMPHRQDTPD